jgi:hypothetical protein
MRFMCAAGEEIGASRGKNAIGAKSPCDTRCRGHDRQSATTRSIATFDPLRRGYFTSLQLQRFTQLFLWKLCGDYAQVWRQSFEQKKIPITFSLPKRSPRGTVRVSLS